MSDYNCFELNIGLNVAGTNNTAARVAAQAIKAVGLLDVLCSACVVRTRVAEVEYSTAGGGAAVEPTLVVSINGSIGSGTLRTVVFSLATELEQDCIAVFEPETGRGVLVGPKAADWGQFNPDCFVRFYQPR